MKSKFEAEHKMRLLFREPTSRLLILSFIFLTAFCVRLYGIGQPPMEFNAVRQYHGALLSRGLYEWLLTGEVKTIPPDGVLEPPILEFVASISYLVLGGEYIWVPRFLSILFWMVGGVFLYLTAKRLFSQSAAIFSVFVYLFDPATVAPSRALLPDSLMVMFLVVSVFAILRYSEGPSTRRLVIAAVVSSLAVLIKPGICLFQVFGAFTSLSIYRRGIRRALASVHLLLFAALAVLPTALYYLYGAFIVGFLEEGQESRIGPQGMLRAYFWQGWLHNIEVMVGYVAFAGGLLGALLTRSGPARALLAGLWGGFLLFGFTFAHHVHTHDYYSLQLVPVVALSLGALWDRVGGYVGRVGLRHPGRVAVLGLCLLALVVSVFEHRQTVAGLIRTENYPRGSLGVPLRTDYQALVEDYREIGEVVDHSHRTIFFAPDFGYSLMYHARVDGEYWPLPGMGDRWERSGGKVRPGMLAILPMDHWPENPKTRFERKDYFDAVYSNASPEYFIVIKRFIDLGHKENWREDSLLMEITEDFRVVAKDENYVVFDLTKKKRGSR